MSFLPGTHIPKVDRAVVAPAAAVVTVALAVAPGRVVSLPACL